LWLSESYLIKASGVSYEYLWKHRHDLKSWQNITHKNVRYYEYYSIPDRAPRHYRSQLPDFDALMEITENKGSKVPDYIEVFESACTDAELYEHHYASLDGKHCNALALAASIIDRTASYIKESAYDLRSYSLFNELAALIAGRDIKYLPKSNRRLKQKIVQRIEGAPLEELVKLPRANNANAIKYQSDLEIEAWLYELASNPKNFSDAYIQRQVKHLCRLSGKTVPSASTLQTYLNNFRLQSITSPQRYGDNTRESAIFQGYIPVARAPHAGDCWQVDATRVNMIAHQRIITEKDKNGNEIRKKVMSNVMVCVVRDVYSGQTLGYSFDYAENHIMYHNALKMAVENAGYLPYELVLDKYPGHNLPGAVEMRETLKLMGVKITITHHAQGKAAVERYFNTIQQTEMQGHDYYYGEGIRSTRKHAHPSPEHLEQVRKKAKREGFDLHETVNIYAGMLETHNSRPYSEYSRKFRHIDESPKELHQASRKPNVRPVNLSNIRQIFGVRTDIRPQANGMLKVIMRHVEHWYRIDDYDIIENNETICVCYDPEDMSSVSMFKRVPNSTWLVHLGTAQQFNPVQMYGPQAEHNRLNTLKKQKESFESIRKQKLQDKVNQANDIEPEVGYENEEATLMGKYTIKKAANGYEDHENNVKQSIYNQLFNEK
jgi:hypothetical protein